jgi:hypothetical protein
MGMMMAKAIMTLKALQKRKCPQWEGSLRKSGIMN